MPKDCFDDDLGRMRILTNNFQFNFEVFRRRLFEVDSAAVETAIFVPEVLDPEDRVRPRPFVETGARPQVDPVVPVSTNLHAVATNIEAKKDNKNSLFQAAFTFRECDTCSNFPINE